MLPYLFALFGELIHDGELPMSLPIFVLVLSMQGLILFGVTIGLGLLLACKVGLQLPLLASRLYESPKPDVGRAFRTPLLVGAATGAAVTAMFYLLFFRFLPGWPSEAAVPIWKRLLACVYGAIDEEVLLRLFLLSLVLWIVQKLARTQVRSAPTWFWVANVIVALIFAAAHLPAASAIMPLTPVVLLAILSLNGIAGLVFGYMAGTSGFEAAMLTHFMSDLVLHLVGPLFAAT